MKQLNFFEPIDLQARLPIGNKRLVNYGIQNEKSDYRVHVGYKTQYIFVFPTEKGRQSIEKMSKDNIQSVSLDDKIITAKGYKVPISWIDEIQKILIPYDIYKKYFIWGKAVTSIKGLLAAK